MARIDQLPEHEGWELVPEPIVIPMGAPAEAPVEVPAEEPVEVPR